MTTRSKLGLVALATAGAVGLGTPGAFASTMTDPELLFISSSSSTFCGSGGACVINNEVNPLTSNKLFIDFNGNGNLSVDSPILLIVGIPDSGTVPTISSTISFNGTSPAGTAQAGGADVYGGTWGVTGIVTGFNGANAYEFLGLNDGSSSESFVNWSSATNAVTGSTPTSYKLAVYELFPSSTFAQGDNIDVTFTSGLAAGDMVVAYSCAAGQSTITGCSPAGNVFATPFTQAGVGEPVPEPASLGIFGAALACLGVFGWRRRQKI